MGWFPFNHMFPQLITPGGPITLSQSQPRTALCLLCLVCFVCLVSQHGSTRSFLEEAAAAARSPRSSGADEHSRLPAICRCFSSVWALTLIRARPLCRPQCSHPGGKAGCSPCLLLPSLLQPPGTGHG